MVRGAPSNCVALLLSLVLQTSNSSNSTQRMEKQLSERVVFKQCGSVLLFHPKYVYCPDSISKLKSKEGKTCSGIYSHFRYYTFQIRRENNKSLGWDLIFCYGQNLTWMIDFAAEFTHTYRGTRLRHDRCSIVQIYKKIDINIMIWWVCWAVLDEWRISLVNPGSRSQ